MSNPATQKATAALKTMPGKPIVPVTAIQAPTGAMAKQTPNTQCDSQVNRFVKE